jgi:hypothetical protein
MPSAAANRRAGKGAERRARREKNRKWRARFALPALPPFLLGGAQRRDDPVEFLVGADGS